VLGVHGFEPDRGVGGVRVRDQLVHGAEHAPGAARDPVQEAARRRIQPGRGVLQQQIGERGDGVQRDEQIRPGGGRETGQLRRPLAQRLLGAVGPGGLGAAAVRLASG
jgi:hypothetical protein